VQRLAEVGAQAAAPVIARPVLERHLGGHLKPGQRWFTDHGGAAGGQVGIEAVDHRLEVQQQSVGAGVVGAQGLIVKGFGAWRHVEDTAVEHDVAAHLTHAARLDLSDHGLRAFHHQLGIAAALHHQRALQHPVTHRAGGVDAGVPDVVGAEQLQAGIGGEQFHHRSRVHGLVFAVGQTDARATGIEGLHHHADGLGRHLGLAQGLAHSGGQLRLRGLGEQGARQQESGPESRQHGQESSGPPGR